MYKLLFLIPLAITVHLVAQQQSVTFNKDVAPILYANCVVCIIITTLRPCRS